MEEQLTCVQQKQMETPEDWLLFFPTSRWINAHMLPPAAEKRSCSAVSTTLTRSVWAPPAPNTTCRSVGSKAGAALNLSRRQISATRVSPLDVVESCCNSQSLPDAGSQCGEHDEVLHEINLAAQMGITGHLLKSEGHKSGFCF